ncbi:hypothetical protein MNBD_UNCLBAC01-1501 [hydrothermal vent metagenome]|uniref:Archaeal ATPase, fused to C-terminal DUF234 domain n=1 Tax=hydrothermal vent metagenome TaxID=652676 RepID=A0A3B1DLY1_9ZZZZ
MNSIGINQAFFGRTQYLDLLKRRVIDLKEGYRQNIAFLGSCYVGKSTLIHYFLANLDEPDVVPIYLDLENKELPYFFFKFTGTLLYNFSKIKNLPLHDDLNLLIESTKGIIPHTIDVIQKIRTDLTKGKNIDTFSGLLTLPEVFTNETGKSCILIFDEFQNLEEFAIADVFQYLGKKIMTQKRCFYILTSSYPVEAKKILAEKLSLLFGNFEIMMVEAFDLQASQQFIEQSLVDKRIGAQLKSFLTDFTGGHPLYLNLICQEVLNLSAIHVQNEIYMPILSQAVENTIFNRWGVISRHFELIVCDLCTGKGGRIVTEILIALSNGQHKTDELLSSIGVKKTQITQRLNRLLELGVIVKNGTFYYLKDKLFKYWVKYVYQKRLKDVELAPDKQRRQFKDEFNACVEIFKVSSRKDFPARIMELLHCFDNEAFNLNGRKYKLPLFQEIVSLKLKSETGRDLDIIKAKTTGSEWFMVTKKENLGESDINLILAESKRAARKPERCVMISLSTIDENARLKALQERFWIWNENELNTLLTLFDKPHIL